MRVVTAFAVTSALFFAGFGAHHVCIVILGMIGSRLCGGHSVEICVTDLGFERRPFGAVEPNFEAPSWPAERPGRVGTS